MLRRRTNVRDWRIVEVLRRYPSLRTVPTVAGGVRLAGELAFDRVFNDVRIQDRYAIEISLPSGFPVSLPSVKEIGGRIPVSFHHLDDRHLCLGSPFRIYLAMQENPSVLAFIEGWVVPYLYGFSHKELYGTLPFGELEHGFEGLIVDLQHIFGVMTEGACLEMLKLAGLSRRMANRQTCPCGSKRRTGRCHNRQINAFRRKMGRRCSGDIHEALSRGRHREKTYHLPRSRRGV